MEPAAVGVEGKKLQFSFVPGSGATLVGATNPNRNTVVPSFAGGVGVTQVRGGAFKGEAIETVFFGKPMESLGESAFEQCQNLATVVFPTTVRTIGQKCFRECGSLEDINLEEGIERIGDEAFAGCASLRAITLPASLRRMGHRTFDGVHPDLIFSVSRGTFAHRWVRRRGYKHSVIEDQPEHESFDDGSGETLTRDGMRFSVLPGGNVSLISLPLGLGRDVAVPNFVEGRKVVGISPGATAGWGSLPTLRLPKQLQWIAAGAVAPTVNIQRIIGLDQVPIVQKDALPQAHKRRKHSKARRALDVDHVLLSLRMVAHVLQVPLPDDLVSFADTPFTGVAAGRLSSYRGNLYFSRLMPHRRTVDALVDKGVEVFVARSPVINTKGVPFPTLIVEDPTEGFINVCAWLGRQYNATTIALTGSIGKTTTKEMVQLVCSQRYNTLFNKGNQNGLAQVGRYVQKQTFQTQVYVQETGAARPGLVEADGRMLAPEAFIITNIGFNHVGDYGGSQDALLSDKLSLDKYLPENGVAFVNYDDPKLRERKLAHHTISFAVDDKTADYTAANIIEAEGELTFDVIDKKEGTSTRLKLSAFGRHNVLNGLVAFAVGKWLSIPVEDIKKGLAQYKGTGLRQNLTVLGAQKVLVDCYNASEQSAKSLSKTLQTISPDAGGSRYLVFGDIDDKLGDLTEEIHRRVGEGFAGEPNVDKYFLLGPHTKWVAEELEARGKPYFHTEEREELHQRLRDELEPGDVIAFKGGQQMALSITVDALFGTSFVLEDGDVLLRRGRIFHAKGLEFREIEEYGVQLRRVPRDYPSRSLVVPGEVEGKPVYMVGLLAAVDRDLEEVTVSPPVRTIARSAFFKCFSLKRVTLPDTLKVIEASAFNNCRSLTKVVIPDGVTTLGRRAFYRCPSLEEIWIPPSVQQMGDQMFALTRNVVVFCEEGSYAADYCEQHDVKYRYV